MRIHSFDWDDTNVKHIARHQVALKEVEEAFEGKRMIAKAWAGRYILLGRSAAGRYLFAVFIVRSGVARAITARDMAQAEKRRYQRGK